MSDEKKVKAMTSLDLLELYNFFLIKQGMETVSKKLNFEDALCLMYMKGRLDTIKEVNKIKYLVIDEAQDYTLLHYKIIAMIFGHCKYTLLGDPNQAIHPFISSKVSGDVEDFLGSKPKHIRLSKTYRSTRQISEFCAKILNEAQSDDNVLRDGEEPTVKQLDVLRDGEQLIDYIKGHLSKGLHSIAIIGKNKEHSQQIYQSLIQTDAVMNKTLEIGLLNDEEQRYKTGVVVIPSYLAKGLEFDSVMVVTDERFKYNHEREGKLFYTVCTRALHELAIFYSDKKPSLLSE
jgi:DNA helicase-2/ATP-dependent DNA helicase PcrA